MRQVDRTIQKASDQSRVDEERPVQEVRDHRVTLACLPKRTLQDDGDHRGKDAIEAEGAQGRPVVDHLD